MPNNRPKCSNLEKEILDIENEIKKLQNELFINLSASEKAEITRKINSLRTELRVLKAELINCKL